MRIKYMFSRQIIVQGKSYIENKYLARPWEKAA